MVMVPPVLIVLDISILSTATTREWLGFSRVGTCHVPQVIYEEMRFLFDRSPDPDLERVAREFNRFYATSGWKITDISGHHPLLKSPTHGLTKRARVALAVARCAYGLAQQFPSHLVVLVASDRALLQRVYETQTPNLTGISGPALLQWSRTGQRPVAVSQKMQQMRVRGEGQPVTQLPNSQITKIPTSQITRPVTTSPSRVTAPRPKTQVRRDPSVSDWLPDVISGVSALVAIAVAALLIWAIFYNADFGQFWRQEPATNQSTHSEEELT